MCVKAHLFAWNKDYIIFFKQNKTAKKKSSHQSANVSISKVKYKICLMKVCSIFSLCLLVVCDAQTVCVLYFSHETVKTEKIKKKKIEMWLHKQSKQKWQLKSNSREFSNYKKEEREKKNNKKIQIQQFHLQPSKRLKLSEKNKRRRNYYS